MNALRDPVRAEPFPPSRLTFSELRGRSHPAAASVLSGISPAVLHRIGEAAVELALWQRHLPAGLADWLNDLPAAQLPVVRLELHVIEAVLALHAVCEACGTPAGAQRDAFIADVNDLVSRFSRLTGSARLRLRLEATQDNACSRFHRDCVPLRLLTTYRGPGTEWVAPAQSAQALAQPDDYAGPTQRLAAHDVALFKGCGFPRHRHDGGVVHRSPRIAGSGVTRLLLCLDVPLDWASSPTPAAPARDR